MEWLCSLCPFSYGLRYTAKVLRDALHSKFPAATQEELYKVKLGTLSLC